MSDRFRTKGSLPFQEVLVTQPVQVYGNVGIAQPISVYFTAPQPVTIPEPVSVYGTVGVSQPVNIYGNVGVFQPVSVYFNTPQAVTLPEPVSVYAPSPLPVVAAQPGLQVYLNAAQLTVLNPSEPPYQIYGSAQGVQVYGNVGVFQPVSVYFATPQAVTVPEPLSVYGSVTATIPQPIQVYGNVTASNQPQPPFQIYGSAQGVQVYGNVGVFQPVSVYFTTPQPVTIPEPVSVYFSTPQAVTIPEPISVYTDAGRSLTVSVAQPLSVYAPSPLPVVAAQPGLQVYGNLGVAQPVSVYTASGTFLNVFEVNQQGAPIQVYGSQPGVQVYFSTPQAVTVPEPVSVYFATPQAVTATVSIPQPLSVYAPSPLPVVAAQPGLQVYGNVGVAQPVSVYFSTPQAVTVPEPVSVYFATPQSVTATISIPQPLSVYAPSPLPVVAAQPGLQIYGNVGVFQPVSVYFQTPQTVSIPEPVSVYHATPQADYLTQPAQVYGNVGVFQPVSVYFGTPQVISVNQPLSVYAATKVGLQVYGNINVFQPVAVYSAPNTPAVNIYDTQVINDSNQTFAGQIGAGSGLNSQIVAPTAGQSLEATLIDIWNIYGAAETVALRFGSAGQFRFIKKLNPNTGFVVNLINSTWRGPTNTGLYVYTWETMGGPLSASGGFVTYTVLGQYLP